MDLPSTMEPMTRGGSPRTPARRALVVSGRARVAAAAAVAFLAVAVAVTTGATESFDRMARDRLRPDDGWGAIQQRLLPIIDGLEPRRSYPLLLVATIIVCLWRWSWRPGAFAGLVVAASTVATLGSKALTHRPDPHGDLATTGGSFPSGHVIALVVCLGAIALMWWRRTRWWHWVLVAVPPAFMSAALLYTAAHWVTDVLGGVLLGIATLCWAASLPLRTSMMEGRRRPGAEGRERLADVDPTWAGPPDDRPGASSPGSASTA